MTDIRNYPQAVEAINAVVSNGGIAEIKVEKNQTLTVVEIVRKVRAKDQ